jgi:pyrimidine-nucleoside phosphorylase
MIGQTGEIAPADKRLYALRDVTATVESIPLIASSIMSKKLAEGIDGLLLDVKVGSGAFMKTEGRARELASAMLAICGKFGKRGRAYLTDMNQPLGEQVGNALEIRESIEVLKGSGPKDVTELTLEFGAAMVLMAGLEADMKAARDRVGKALFDGRALERFARMVEAQGGDPRVVDDFGLLPVGPQRSVLRADSGGWVAAIDTEGLGIASMMLGAGREKAEDCVDPSVGLTVQVKVGDRIEPGRPLVTLWHRDGDARTVEAVMRRAVAAFCMAQEPVDPPKLVLDVLQTA